VHLENYKYLILFGTVSSRTFVTKQLHNYANNFVTAVKLFAFCAMDNNFCPIFLPQELLDIVSEE
jgi:hypothetical protein